MLEFFVRLLSLFVDLLAWLFQGFGSAEAPHKAKRDDALPTERFDEHALRTLSLAQLEVERLRQEHIEPEHILVGLLRAGGPAQSILEAAGITYDAIYASPHYNTDPTPGAHTTVSLADSTRNVLELAVLHADKRVDHEIGTAHLLAALLRSRTQHTVARIFRDLGQDPQALYERIWQAELHPLRDPARGSNRRVNSMMSFTMRSRHVLSLAKAEAVRLQQPTITSEHLLLGLLNADSGVAQQVLHKAGITAAAVLASTHYDDTAGPAASAEPDLDASIKRVLELAVDEARARDHHSIDTEHLLAALLQLHESTAVRILQALGHDPLALYNTIWVNDEQA